ncbi:hypothetical protein IJ750_02650 [bacterium]|nr:hypothetical protein [bacterium]
MRIVKVILNFHDYDEMEIINKITGANEFNDENWVNLEIIEAHPELLKYIPDEQINALKNGDADHIVFSAE